MHKFRSIAVIFGVILLFSACTFNNVIDSNHTVSDNNWTYSDKLKEKFEIKDASQPYDLNFKLRHTNDYRYSNIYIIVRLKGNGLKKANRYQFKLAKSNGEWLGKGSGDIFTYNLPLLSQYRFPKAGSYELEIEQNMRDNPLVGISDIGLNVALSTSK